tara:strand:- start:16115 stop:16246 length:132 start_codon:yes stop_codon:yes gene_type:complete
MKYFVIFTVMSIAGTAGLVVETKEEVPVEHIEFVEPIYINVNI